MEAHAMDLTKPQPKPDSTQEQNERLKNEKLG
jgi:hypothetical protein